MATDRSGTTLSGLLVPDPRFTHDVISAALSTGLTQAGPVPGVPEPYDADQGSSLVLEASGTQAASTSYRVVVARAGMPGLDECGVHWYDDSSSPATGPYGWEPPVSISGNEVVQYSASVVFAEPHAIRLASGNVMLVYRDDVAGELRSRLWTASTATWGSAVTIVSTSLLGTGDKSPTVTELPDGRLLCFYWKYDDTAALAQVASKVTTDEGTSWSTWSPFSLRYDIDTTATTPHRMRAAYLDGQLLLVASQRWAVGTYHDRWTQWASSDLGCTWAHIEDSDGSSSAESCAYLDLVVAGGSFLLGYIEVENSALGAPGPLFRRLGDAYTPLSSVATSTGHDNLCSAEWGVQDGGGTYVDVGDFALVVDEDGACYCYGRSHGAGKFYQGMVGRSADFGSTWDPVSAAGELYPWYDAQDTSTYPRAFCAVAQGGRVMMPSAFASNPDTHDSSCVVLSLGGYTTVSLPARGKFAATLERVVYSRTWLPYDLPDNTGGLYTLSTTGIPTAPALASGKLLLITLLGETITYTSGTPSGSLAEGIIVEVEAQVTTGTSVLEVRIGDGAQSYVTQVNLTTTAISILDVTGAVVIGTASTAAAATGVRIRVAMADNDVSAWYAVPSVSRRWISIGSSGSVTGTGAAGTHRVQWSQGASTISNWSFVAYVSGSYTGLQLATGQDTSTLFPRSLTTLAETIAGGVKLRGVDGPGGIGDAFTVATAYEYGVEHIDHQVSPSPRRAWRSLDTSTACTIAWDLDAADGETGLLSPLAAVYLSGINWRLATWDGRSGGAWTTLATIDAAEGMTGLLFLRAGDTLRVDTGTSNHADMYFPTNILAGSHVKLDDGAGNVVYRTIAGNTDGAWTSAATRRPIIRLSDATSADPTSGTMQIWMKEAFVAWHQPSATYDAYRLVIAHQSTADGYYQGGIALPGRVHVWGQAPGWGRILGLEPGVSVLTARSGARRARELGPARRSAELSWMDAAVDTSGIGGTNPTPDYLTGYTGSTSPVATVAGTPYDWVGLVEELRGAKVPVVYLPSLTRSSSSSGTIKVANRSLMLYSRIVSAPRLETVLGDEWSSPGEVIRIATAMAQEEL